MKLTDLKEWGGRDLPGFGDEATWGGRHPDDDEGEARAYDRDANAFEAYIQHEYTETPELEKDCFVIDPGEFSKFDDEAAIKEALKLLGYKVSNDTGHPFAAAFHHAMKPVWNFCCDGPERWVKNEHLEALTQLCAPAGKEFTITELQALCKKWFQIVDASPTTKKEIRDEFND